jgi:hypothetical protein
VQKDGLVNMGVFVKKDKGLQTHVQIFMLLKAFLPWRFRRSMEAIAVGLEEVACY